MYSPWQVVLGYLYSYVWRPLKFPLLFIVSGLAVYGFYRLVAG